MSDNKEFRGVEKGSMPFYAFLKHQLDGFVYSESKEKKKKEIKYINNMAAIVFF